MPDLSKVPPWAWALGAVGVGAGVYLYKKHADEAAASSENAESSNSETATATEPYPYSYGGGEEGYGGSGGYGAAVGEAEQSEQDFRELFSDLTTQEREQAQAEKEQQTAIGSQIAESQKSIEEILKQNASVSGGTTTSSNPASTVSEGSGGGAPSSGTGTVQQPVTQQHAASCPAAYPNLNGSSPSAATCYKDMSKAMTGPKGAKVTCTCHVYQNGHNECQTVVNGKCQW